MVEHECTALPFGEGGTGNGEGSPWSPMLEPGDTVELEPASLGHHRHQVLYGSDLPFLTWQWSFPLAMDVLRHLVPGAQSHTGQKILESLNVLSSVLP